MPEKNNKNLIKFFNPNSISIIGASRHEKKVGHIVLKNIVNSGFGGKIFPVNPNADNLEGIACYANYKDLPEVPDLAILAVPAETAVALLDSIAKKGTKNIIIFSAGFKEIGLQGEKLENQLRLIAEKHKLNILGPNCLGFVNTSCNLNATFSQAGGVVGNLRFISQSGALASGIFDWAKHYQVGFSEFITLGNKTLLNENDILQYWLENSNKQPVQNLSGYWPIGMYLESIDSGKEFLKLVSKISITDPVFILKPGKSKKAKQAMQSHTGSMAGDDAVQDVAFKEAGMIRCEGLEDMFDLAKIFSWTNAPEGPNVAIVSNAGGPAVISTDALEKYGLQMANPSKKTQVRLKEKLPREASVLNPVDVLGDALADRYGDAINEVLSDKDTHALLVILTPQIMTEIEATAETIGRLAKKHGKPVICSFIGGDMIDKGEAILNTYKIPSFRFPERAIMALARMWQWHNEVKRRKLKVESKQIKLLTNKIIKKINKILESAKKHSRQALTILEADKVLNLCGIRTPRSMAIQSLEQAQWFAQKTGWPVVLKISSPAVLHKTEKGGVVTGINNPIMLEKAWKKISLAISKLPKKSPATVVVQQQVLGGLEVIVGIKHDSSFGNVLMFGAGGVLTELIADNNLMLFPAGENGVGELISKSKIFPLLNGYRGRKSYNMKKFVEIIVRLGRLADSISLFAELEINPIILTEKNAWAVDGRIILKNIP